MFLLIQLHWINCALLHLNHLLSSRNQDTHKSHHFWKRIWYFFLVFPSVLIPQALAFYCNSNDCRKKSASAHAGKYYTLEAFFLIKRDNRKSKSWAYFSVTSVEKNSVVAESKLSNLVQLLGCTVR